MRFRMVCLLFAVCAVALPVQSQIPDVLRSGQHAVGFRVIETRDRSRITRPPTDFSGRPATGDLTVPIQIAVWYPAVRPATAKPMSTFDLLLTAVRKEKFGLVTSGDSTRVRADIPFTVRLASADSSSAEARVDSVLSTRTKAYLNAAPVNERFPVAVIGADGTIASTSALAEYLASNGWLVLATPGAGATAALQVTSPRLAIEDRVRALEFAIATAYTISQADTSRLALVGINFDSHAVLELQMRQMRASAIVTINGWQTIDDRAARLRESLWYEPKRIRVPVLNFHWDETGPNFAPVNLSFMEELKYSDRRNITLSGLGHFGLIGNPLLYQFTAQSQKRAYAHLTHTVLSTLDSAVGKGDPAAAEPIPSELLKSDWRRAALKPVPTRAEFLELLWDRADIPEAVRVFREARMADSTVQFFQEQDMGLYIFRYTRSGRLAEAVTIGQLIVDGYPRSATAHNTLGNVLVQRGDTAAAIRSFETALRLLETTSTLSPQDKAAQERAWREKVAGLRQRM